MEGCKDANFGIVISDIIKEMDQVLVKSMSEQGKTEEEIIAYFESDQYVKNYVDTVSPMLINSFSESLEKYIVEDDEEARKEQDFYLEHLRTIWGIGIAWMKQYRIKCLDICDGWGWYINQSHIKSDRCNVFHALYSEVFRRNAAQLLRQLRQLQHEL